MSLTSSQRKALFDALLSTYDVDSFEQLLFFGTGKELEQIVSTNENMKNILFAVLKTAIKGGWLGELIRAVATDEDVADRQELQALLAELQSATNLQPTFAPHIDPFEACFLRTGGQLPFVNRRELRSYTTSMLEPNGYKVLLVDGPPRSGKSYTREFIEHLSTCLESYEFYYIDLEEAYFPGFLPSDLMIDIALRMGINPDGIPPKDAQSARWIRNLATWLAGESTKHFNDDGRMWWIIIDSIRKVNLSTDMRDLLNRMVSQAEFSATAMRIILLDYGGPTQLPANLQDRVGSEQISNPERDALTAFLQRASAQSGTEFDDDGLNAVVDWVIAEASAETGSATGVDDQRSFVERMAIAIEEAHRLFFAEVANSEEVAIP